MSEMSEVAGRSIRTKLAVAFIAATSLALLVSSAAFMYMETVRYRDATERTVSVLAEVVGFYSEPFLVFSDAAAGGEVVSALAAETTIQSATIYAADGTIFASYSRDGEPPAPVMPKLAAGLQFDGTTAQLAREIKSDGALLGTLHIRIDTSGMTTQLLESAGIMLLIMGGALLASWGIASRLRNQIADPLAAIVLGSAAMAEGDLRTEVSVTSDDEIGMLARSYDRMRVSLRAVVSTVLENSQAVSEASSTLGGESQSMAAEAARQETAVEESAQSIERVSESAQLVTATVQRLADTSAGTSNSAAEMDRSIAQIAHHVDSLFVKIDGAASSVIEMTAAVRQIASNADGLGDATSSTLTSLSVLRSTVQEVEGHAQQSHELSTKAADRARNGAEAVSETIEGMQKIQVSFQGLEQIIQRLAEKSRSIDEILKVIEGVVAQTNLLALNAAIISSQAGEHGRAFAVVADEVKTLADRTAASARDIGHAVQGVRDEVEAAVESVAEGAQHVERGAELSADAGRVLSEISEISDQSSEMVSLIVQATSNQTRDIASVDAAAVIVKELVDQIRRATHEQDSTSIEIRNAVESMSDLGNNVRTLTTEQTSESRAITASVEEVASGVHQILESVTEQGKELDQLLGALQVFRDGTTTSTARAESVKAMVDSLVARSLELDASIGRFRL